MSCFWWYLLFEEIEVVSEKDLRSRLPEYKDVNIKDLQSPMLQLQSHNFAQSTYDRGTADKSRSAQSYSSHAHIVSAEPKGNFAAQPQNTVTKAYPANTANTANTAKAVTSTGTGTANAILQQASPASDVVTSPDAPKEQGQESSEPPVKIAIDKALIDEDGDVIDLPLKEIFAHVDLYQAEHPDEALIVRQAVPLKVRVDSSPAFVRSKSTKDATSRSSKSRFAGVYEPPFAANTPKHDKPKVLATYQSGVKVLAGKKSKAEPALFVSASVDAASAGGVADRTADGAVASVGAAVAGPVNDLMKDFLASVDTQNQPVEDEKKPSAKASKASKA